MSLILLTLEISSLCSQFYSKNKKQDGKEAAETWFSNFTLAYRNNMSETKFYFHLQSNILLRNFYKDVPPIKN